MWKKKAYKWVSEWVIGITKGGEEIEKTKKSKGNHKRVRLSVIGFELRIVRIENKVRKCQPCIRVYPNKS